MLPDILVVPREKTPRAPQLEETPETPPHLGVAGRLPGTVSPFRAEQGTSLETPWRRSEGTGDGLRCPQPIERESGSDPRIRSGGDGRREASSAVTPLSSLRRAGNWASRPGSPPNNFIKRAFKRRVNSTKQLLKAGRGHQAPRKATQLFERR